MERSTTGRAGQAAKATAGTEAIEVKVTVVERDEAMTLRMFGLERDKGQPRGVFFYDTPALELYNNGVALRARDTGDECDSTVKIRPVDPQRVTEKCRKKSGFKIEADIVGTDVIRLASFRSARSQHCAGSFGTKDFPTTCASRSGGCPMDAT